MPWRKTRRNQNSATPTDNSTPPLKRPQAAVPTPHRYDLPEDWDSKSKRAKKSWYLSHDPERRLVSKPIRSHRGMEEACFPHLYEPINHTKPSSKTERHSHLAHAHDFLFWYFPSPKIRGAGWGGGAQQQQQKSAAAAAAVAARQGKRDKYTY